MISLTKTRQSMDVEMTGITKYLGSGLGSCECEYPLPPAKHQLQSMISSDQTINREETKNPQEISKLQQIVTRRYA